MALLEAWRFAYRGGKPFEVTSARPVNTMDAARRRSVRVSVDVDEDGVRAELSHVASRHPTWTADARATIPLTAGGSGS